MLISDSTPLLWLCWFVLSLIVLIAGYFAISFLPRLPRALTTAAIAGALWMPAPFSVPGPEAELGYSGWAPAMVVTAVGVLQGNSAQFAYALALMLLGALVLAVAVFFLLRLRGGGGKDDRQGDHNRRRNDQGGDRRRRSEGQRPRREPSLGS